MGEEKVIPEVTITEKGFQEETRSIPIKVNGKEEEIVLRKITAGTRGKIRNECTKIRHLGGQTQVDVNDAELEIKTVHAAIVSAPFPHTIEEVKKMPAEVLDYIILEYAEFAGVSDKKKEE